MVSEMTTTALVAQVNRSHESRIQGSWGRLEWSGGDEGGHHLRHQGKHHGRHHGHGAHDHQGTTPGGVLIHREEPCYSGNEVLLVIGLTCLLNFAFILLVMACVHYCNGRHPLYKSDSISRLESVVVESCSEAATEEEEEEEEEEDDEDEEETGGSLLSLRHLGMVTKNTPSHSMEQLLFID